MKPTVYGYARVSTHGQNLDRQLTALAKAKVPKTNIFADTASGRNFDRPAWQDLVARIKKNDVLVVKSIDRLGRNYNDILEQWRMLTKEKGVDIVVVDIPLLDTRIDGMGVTRTFIFDLILQLLSYVAEVEREYIHVRQAEGIAAARARGVHMGRPAKRRPDTYAQVKSAYTSGFITRIEASAQLQVSASTFTRWLRADNEKTRREKPTSIAKTMGENTTRMPITHRK